jgi:hypothetical protein
VSAFAQSVSIAELPGRLGGDLSAMFRRPSRLAAAAIAIGVAVLLIVWFPREVGARAAPSASPLGDGASNSAEASFDAIWAQQPRIDLGIPADGAKVVIVKFNDWQCPSCKAGYYAYKALLERYAQTMPGAIKYVTKDFPLNGRCNFGFVGIGHPAACEAAAAVRLAAEHDRATEMTEWLFGNQEALTPQSVEAQVRSMLGITDFATQYERLLPAIKRDVADGVALHIDATPTYYVNGVKAQTPAPEKAFLAADYFDYAIRYELRKAGAAK